VEVLAPIPEAVTGRLVLGSRVIGRIHLASHRGLVVPRSAVLQDDAGTYLFRLSNGKAGRVNVQTGIEQEGWVEVSGDIHAGDGVVSEGNYELADGMAVREIAP